MKNWHKDTPNAPVMPYNTLIHTETQMTEQELMELWGDGTQFGMNTEMVGALNNAFREVAVKFARVVADKAYDMGYDDGRYEGYEKGVRSGVLGD